MLKLLRAGGTSLETIKTGPKWQLPPDAIWLDLCNPTREEEVCLEAALKLHVDLRKGVLECVPGGDQRVVNPDSPHHQHDQKCEQDQQNPHHSSPCSCKVRNWRYDRPAIRSIRRGQAR